MQQPRRTSQFQEDAPGTEKKRQTRGSTLRVRTHSLDRASCNFGAAVGANQPSSSKARGTTPQRVLATPKHSLRPPLTAEKLQRSANRSAPCHNDKRWVQERCALITKHLHEAYNYGMLGGTINDNFFGRGLRQMSTKQFIDIVNYFLHYVWGNRFIVNFTNYVEDIVSYLQKLQYPYQVNKSWLKTPNTQHSFGNVIVLLDYLMDFVPPSMEEADAYFICGETTLPKPGAGLEEDHFVKVPDAEFQTLLLHHSEQGFQLWDKQLDEDFEKLQRQSCDALVQKHCGLKDLKALDAELDILAAQANEMEQNLVHIPAHKQQLCEQLSNELEYVLKSLRKVQVDLEKNAELCTQAKARQKVLLKEVAELENDIAQAKATISRQTCSRAQREKLIEETGQLKHILQCKNRTLNELQERNHQQQVLLSRTKKQVTNQIEKFNAHMRELSFSREYTGFNFELEALQLPLKAKQADLDKLLPRLHSIKKQIEQILNSDVEQARNLQNDITILTNELESKVEPKRLALSTAFLAAQNALEQFEKVAKLAREKRANKLKELMEQASAQATAITQQQQHINVKQIELRQLEQQNELVLTQAEKEYKIHADAREALLEQNATLLERATLELQQLTETVEKNEVEFELLKKRVAPQHEKNSFKLN